MLSSNIYAQSFFGGSRVLNGLELIYAGKFVQDGTVGHVPTVSGNQYNPYNVTVTTFYDSVGACRITLSTFPSSVNALTANLHPLAMSNTPGFTAKVWATASALVVTTNVYIKQYDTFANAYTFELWVYVIK